MSLISNSGFVRTADMGQFFHGVGYVIFDRAIVRWNN